MYFGDFSDELKFIVIEAIDRYLLKIISIKLDNLLFFLI